MGTLAKEFDPWPRHCPFQKVNFACVEFPLGRQKLKVRSLERILVSKLAANRTKHRLTIPVLRDALAATKSVKRRARRK